jgi:DmsE family decaheme c-type cytochrome
MRRRQSIAEGWTSGVAMWLAGLMLAVGLGFSTSASAEEAAGKTSAKLGPGDTVLRGDAKCTGCHDDSDNPSPTMLEERPWVLSIGKTKHGTVADSRTPTCTTCHGESASHMKKSPDGTRPSPDRVFKKTTPADVQNGVCTTCHKGGNRMFWENSTHQDKGLTCTTCHDIHNNGHDKVRDRHTQSEVCYTCHKDKRAEFNRPSHHPVKEGTMACSDCHNPHGSAGPKQLKRSSVNETCYQCHMEKRGPFLHNHQPVNEDCTICHNPHGTTIGLLLKSRPPFLCQQCHNDISSGHPGQLGRLPTGPTTSTSQLGTVGRGCLNCHTSIHGDNNPQGSTATRRFFR